MASAARVREICEEFVDDKINATTWRSRMVSALSRINDVDALLIATMLIDIRTGKTQ